MATLEEQIAAYQAKTGSVGTGGSGDVNLATSILAGLGSGVFKIFEGVASLGATLLDLGVDRDRAEAVEEFFDKINPFDEAAEATAAGKITELIVNIGVPGGVAFKVGSGLTKAALRAKEAGTYLSRAEKVRRFGQGALAGGVAEGVFVGNVDDAGTFGDFLGGPTAIDRNPEGPGAELLNRLKFGIEGAAFTGAIGAAGATLKRMRKVRGTNKAKEGFDKGIDKLDSWFRANGIKPQEGFDIAMKKEGALAKDINFSEGLMRDIDNLATKIANNYQKTAVNKIDNKVVKDRILRQMNDVLMSGSAKNGKLKPLFGQVDEIAIDTTTGRPFKTGAGVLKDLEVGSPLPKTADIPNPLDPTKVNTVNTKTGRQLYDVQIDRMDEVKVNKLRKILKERYKVDDEDVKDLLGSFVSFRGKLGELFTSMGRRFNPEALETFEEMLPKYINDVVDRGYDVFKNNKTQWSTALNYPPTKAIINQAVEDFKFIADRKGIALSDEAALRLVNSTWRGASIDKGFRLGVGQPSIPRLKSVPEFMVKSLQDKLDPKILDKTTSSNLAELTGMSQQVVKRLLGKSKNPMNSIVEGTQNLSAQVRSNEFFDNLILKNNVLKKRYDEWLAGGRVGPEPRIPFLYNNTGEAMKYAGGSPEDFARIGGAADQAAFNIKVDKWTDSKGALKEIDTTKQIQNAAEVEAEKILNPLNGKVALKDYAESFTDVTNIPKSFARQMYNNLILYPKGMSQMSKTILAPFTHARNFLSATAFAAANGILPFGNTKDVKAAWNALQVTVPGARKSNEFYQELLDLGVVNSQVQLGDLRKLLEDVDFGGTLNKLNSDWGLKRLLNRLNKIKKGAQDAYTAEDDFWKIFTYLGEKTKLADAYRGAGLQLGQEFIDPNGVKQIFNDEYLKKTAADLVKNNVPNYAFVSDFIKGLRKLPVGNFVAFPAEIIRTSANIVESALKEINYKVVINGEEVRPLLKRGLTRLAGMGVTTTALPLGLIATTQAIYDISKDEIDAMRRFVPEWSKNSTLIPFRNDDGKFSYVDFSHLNAYDTVTRPITTVLNAVNQGRADEDGLVDDFVLGLIESTKELGSPFLSESIWTQGLADIFVRNGRTREGSRVWNPRDSIGDKLSKSIGHLVETQAPLNWKQMERLGLSLFPSDSTGRFSERGDEYTFGNEALGILGLRRVTVDPEKSFNFKITDFKKGVRDSRNLFTAATLKGGPVTPKEVVDAYINANRSLYAVNRDLYQDIKAAQTLGMRVDSLDEKMSNRGESRAFNSLIEGDFRPLKISRDVRDLFEIKSQNLGIRNPLEAAQDVLDRISEVLELTPLKGDLFPRLQNPFDIDLFSGIVDQVSETVTATTPVATTAGFGVGLQNTNIDPVSGLTASQEVLLDPLEQRYVKNKNRKTNTILT